MATVASHLIVRGGRRRAKPRLFLLRLSSSSSFCAFSSDSKFFDMSSPSYMLWGANTDVGKTLVSTGLSISLLSRARHVLYVKPVQTGFPKDSDGAFVARNAAQAFPRNGSGSGYGPPLASSAHHAWMLSPAAAEACASSNKPPCLPSPLLLPPLLQRLGARGNQDPSGMTEFNGYEVVSDSNNGDGDGDGCDRIGFLTCTTLWSWLNPVSPHLAVEQEGGLVSDKSIVDCLRALLDSQSVSNKERSWTLVETAGGVASPGPSGHLQCDIFRPLRMPGVLVGDGRLGGISSTIAAYESLQIRGYDVAAIIMTDTGLANHKLLLNHFYNKVPVLILPSVPPSGDLKHWFLQSTPVFDTLRQTLEATYLERTQRLQCMPEKALKMIWWPFTQHSLIQEQAVTLIDSRCGENFAVYKDTGEDKAIFLQFDACASWWTQGPDQELQQELARQIAYCAGRFGHVMLPENVHEPALKCTELLLEGVGKGWADRVYFSDNGSTSIEIAIKMAFRKFLFDKELVVKPTSNLCDMERCELKVLGLKGSYHGDTLGAQDAQSPSSFTGFLQQPWYQGRGLFLDPPLIFMSNRRWNLNLPSSIEGRAGLSEEELRWPSREALFNKERDFSKVAGVYSSYISEILDHNSDLVGALILEPVIHGAGGMHLIDPLFQRTLVRECKSKRIPVIFDEVFSGCWRLGAESAAEILGCTPDIGCYSKLLTGGMVPLAATLASQSIFEAFGGESKLLALLHGHSYSGHAIGCQAATTALQWLRDPSRNKNLVPGGRRLKELWDEEIVAALSAHPSIQRVVSIGTVFALELQTEASNSGYSSLVAKELVQCLRDDGVYVRPLGNVIYLMCGPTTTSSSCSMILQKLHRHINDFFEKSELAFESRSELC